MKKNQTVQGTFSKIFGKKHANPNATSLYATNPPWIFAQEAPEEGTRDFGKCARGRAVAAPAVGRRPAALRATELRALGGARGGGKGTRPNLRTGHQAAAGMGRRRHGVSRRKGRGGQGCAKEGTLPVGKRRPLRSASDPSPSSQVFIFPPGWKLGLCRMTVPGACGGPSSPCDAVESEGPPQLRARGGPLNLPPTFPVPHRTPHPFPQGHR